MLLRFAATLPLFAALALPTSASADPDPAPPPPIPNVNAYAPLNPVDYSALGGRWYAFAGPSGVICIINRQNSDYACSGSLPGAPDGMNLVSGAETGPPAFSAAAPNLFAGAGAVKPLPPNARLSFRDISCGAIADGGVACLNSRDQVGFVVSPAGSFVNGISPLLDRPKGTNPYLPGMPTG